MKSLSFLFLIFLVVNAMGAGVREDTYQIGKPGSGTNKEMIFDVGDGANNPKIIIDSTNKDFELNKAAKVAGDILTVGDGTNSQKEVVFDIGNGANNPRFRWNSAESVLEFSLNGSEFSQIGSGTGGGVGDNLLSGENADFETGTPPSDWTASGGTFSAETGSPLFGDQSGSWDANSLDQTLDSNLISVTSGYLGARCQVELKYRYSGSAGDYQLIARQFDDSAGSESDVLNLDLEPTGGDKRDAQAFFDCPDDAADSLKLRVQSKVADPGAIVVDDAFIGTGRNTFQLSQAEVVTHAFYEDTANCSWQNSTTSIDSFGTDADCPAITVDQTTQDVDTTDDDLPTLSYTNLEPGKYKVEVELSGSATPGSEFATFAISDGTNTKGSSTARTTDATDRYPINITAVFDHTSSGPKTFEVFASASSGATAVITNASENQRLTWTVTKYPLNKADALTLESSGAFLRAFHDNTCDFSVSSSSYADTQGDSTCGFTIDQSVGFENTVSTDDGTNTNAGTTTEFPWQGRWEACAHFSVITNTNNARNNFRMVYEGNPIVETAFQDGDATTSQEFPVELCGTFDVTNTNATTLKIQAKNSSTTSSITSVGKENFSVLWEIKPEGQFMDQFIFTDVQSSLSERVSSTVNDTRIETCHVNDSGVIESASGMCANWIDSVSGPPIFTVNFTSGTWSSPPICTCSAVEDAADNTNDRICKIETTPTTSSFEMRTTSGNTNSGVVGVMFTCYGQK